MKFRRVVACHSCEKGRGDRWGIERYILETKMLCHCFNFSPLQGSVSDVIAVVSGVNNRRAVFC